MRLLLVLMLALCALAYAQPVESPAAEAPQMQPVTVTLETPEQQRADYTQMWGLVAAAGIALFYGLFLRKRLVAAATRAEERKPERKMPWLD